MTDTDSSDSGIDSGMTVHSVSVDTSYSDELSVWSGEDSDVWLLSADSDGDTTLCVMTASEARRLAAILRIAAEDARRSGGA